MYALIWKLAKHYYVYIALKCACAINYIDVYYMIITLENHSNTHLPYMVKHKMPVWTNAVPVVGCSYLSWPWALDS